MSDWGLTPQEAFALGQLAEKIRAENQAAKIQSDIGRERITQVRYKIIRKNEKQERLHDLLRQAVEMEKAK